MALGVLLPFGCASNKASDGKAAAPKSEPAASSQPASTTSTPPAEEEALVRVKEKMFPPVDVGAWLCEPRSWNDKGQVRLHCTAPAGTSGLQAALKDDPSVADVEPVQ